jgi:hypothetical protein
MIDILREAQGRFQDIHNLLEEKTIRDNDYFVRLNEATQEAYITMNEGMCASTTVCHQCASHRDFLHSIIITLEELEGGSPLSSSYEERLRTLSEKVTEILTRISTVLTTL